MTYPLTFHRSLRSVFKFGRDLEMRSLVASVHVPVKLLTDAERERQHKVEALVAEGKNPYSRSRRKEEGLEELGGSSLDEMERARIRAEIAEAAVHHKLNTRVGKPPAGILFEESSPIFKELGLDLPPSIYRTGTVCSFCGVPVDANTATEGRGPLRGRVETELIRSLTTGEVISFKDKIKFTSSNLWACPACSLQLTQHTLKDQHGMTVLDKEGEPLLVGAKTKFPEFD